MAKQAGLAQKLLAGGYDISGDVQQLENVHGGPALLDVTAIDKEAHERIGGERDGGLGITVFMDPANAHPVLSALPTADVGTMYLLNPLGVGAPSACCIAKQVGYDPNRAASGELTLKCQFDANGDGLEWGVALTSGTRTDTAATNGTSLDRGAGFTTPAVPASGTPVTNTAPIPASVVISGGTLTNVAVNGVSVGTGDGTYVVPSGGTITLTYTVAPTWTWTLQTTFGAQSYLQVTAFTGTDVTVTVQHSADNATWSTLIAFTAVTAAPAAQRVTATGTVDRYLRAITTTTGGFTLATFAAVVAVNQTATSF